MAKKKVGQMDLQEREDLSPEREWRIPPKFDSDGVQSSSGIGMDGKEYPDPVPTKPAVTLQQRASVLNTIRDFVHSERLRQLADQEGFDTEEEANDFEVEDEYIPDHTPYEKHFFPDKTIEAAASAAAPSAKIASPEPPVGKQGGSPVPDKPDTDIPADKAPTGQPGSSK